MLLLAISLLAGLLTVLAPCTISLLPVIVGGTLSGVSRLLAQASNFTDTKT
jgi:cytochrome c biogenesis protein CcdA